MTALRRSVPLGEIKPNPKNDNLHPREQIALIKAALERYGQTKPLLLRKANKMLIAGHGVYRAMQELGWKEADCYLLDVDQITADKLMLGDNRLSELSHPDIDKRRELLALLGGDEEIHAAGFLPDEIKELLGQDDDDEVEILEIDTDLVDDNFIITITGPIKTQAYVLQRLRTLMADVPEVDVELGSA